jgi:hypothetical protein
VGEGDLSIFRQRVNGTGTAERLTNAGDGHHPIWPPNGAELLFTPGLGNRLSAVRVTTQAAFTFGDATPVPRPFPNVSGASERPYDVSRDGQQFLGLVEAARTQSAVPATPRIYVVLNWFEKLDRKAPRMAEDFKENPFRAGSQQTADPSAACGTP